MQRADGSLWLDERHAHPIEFYYRAQGSTNDCGPHATAAALGFCTGTPVVVSALIKEMNQPHLRLGIPPLVIRRIPNWATLPWGIVDVLREHGLKAAWRFRATEDDLRRALREDHVPLPVFGEPLRRRGLRWTGWSHVAVLAGWDPARETYWFVDSARSTPLTGRAQETFSREWQNMGRLLIQIEA